MTGHVFRVYTVNTREPLQFDWDAATTNHIARHRVRPEEAEQALAHGPLEVKAVIRKGESRRLCIGRTDSGRLLDVVYTVRNKKIRVVTAHPTNRRQRRIYESQKAAPTGQDKRTKVQE